MNDHDALPPDSAANAERYADTRHVLHGPDGPGVLRTVLYATYVGALLAATYGYTVARGIFATSDREWLRSVLLSPGAALALGAAVVGVVLVAFRAGQVRGPVVPPLPWTDLVVTSALDRPLVLRDWWLVSSTLAVVGGVLGGGVVGAGLWGAGAAGGLALVGGLVGGAAVGGAAVWAWLLGEARDPAYAVRGRVVIARPRRVLADLRMGTLRAQGVRTTHLGGAILAGDLRAARLEVASPIRRARRALLRASRPWTTIAVPDDVLSVRVLGLPGSGISALFNCRARWRPRISRRGLVVRRPASGRGHQRDPALVWLDASLGSVGAHRRSDDCRDRGPGPQWGWCRRRSGRECPGGRGLAAGGRGADHAGPAQGGRGLHGHQEIGLGIPAEPLFRSTGPAADGRLPA